MARRSGLVVLLMAVLIVAVPALRPRHVDGTAAAIPLPGPPAAGDCVSEPAQQYPGYGNRAGGTYAYPQLPIEPCTGTRFAEVVAVFTDPVQPNLTVDGSALNVVDGNQDRCAAAVVAYVGRQQIGDTHGLLWVPMGFWQASLSRPTTRQEAAGQHWVACLAGARGPGSEQVAQPYPGSLRDSVTTGVARDRTGACPTGTDLDDGSAPAGCLQPHTLQLLAVADARPELDRSAVDEGCAWVAARLTGRSDLDTGGILVVRTQIVDRNGGAVGDGSVPVDGSILCGVSTVRGRTLSGGLGAIGDAPLPWT